MPTQERPNKNVIRIIIYVDSSYNKVPVHTFVSARLQSSDVSLAIRSLRSSVLLRPFLHLTLVSIRTRLLALFKVFPHHFMSTSGFSHRSYYLLSIPHPYQRFFMHGFRIRSGVFSGPRGFRSSLLRPLAEDMSAYAYHRRIPPQAKYRCVNLVMRMLGSTNLSCR